MKIRCLLVLAILAGLPSTITAQALTDAEVADAIATAGGSPNHGLHLAEFSLTSVTGFSAWIYPPQQWIRNIAAKARAEFRTPTTADISVDDRADVWRVQINPSMPTNIKAAGANVTHAVLRDKKATFVVQPSSKEPFTRTAQNAMGATVSYNGLAVTFPGPDVRILWGPNQDQPFFLSVIGDTWRYDFEIKDKHFERLGAVKRKRR